MRIMTVRQPWAHAIVHCGKDVENRGRNIAGAYRGPAAIHAATRTAGLNLAQVELLEARGDETIRAWLDGEDIIGGVIIGVVDLVDVHHGDWCWDGPGVHCSPWGEPDVYHLVLANPRPLADPIPYKGALGLRTLDEATAIRVWEAIA